MNVSGDTDAIPYEYDHSGRAAGEAIVDQRELIDRAKRGDHDAFAELVDGALRRLDAAARLILRDPDLAQDAVQESLIRAWRDLPGLRDPARFDAWLHRLTVNACLDLAQRPRTLTAPDERRDQQPRRSLHLAGQMERAVVPPLTG
jgi:DNA-directed RNA polymerase specialized sigma24 family protein